MSYEKSNRKFLSNAPRYCSHSSHWLNLRFGCFEKFGACIASIPDCVLGGMTTFLFLDMRNKWRKASLILQKSLELRKSTDQIMTCAVSSSMSIVCRGSMSWFTFVFVTVATKLRLVWSSCQQIELFASICCITSVLHQGLPTSLSRASTS